MTQHQETENVHQADQSKKGSRSILLWSIIGVSALLLIGAIAAGPIMSQVAEPKYEIVASDGAIEIRSYATMIAAQAEVAGERKPAIEEGFRLIAAYIFGANKPNAKIAMTAPVQQQSAEQSSQKIAMTAPVTQQQQSGIWTVRFIMPSEWTMESLPEPSSARVKLVPIAAKRMAVILFSGTATDSLIDEKTRALRDYITGHHLSAAGEPVLAFYNPPWTLPIFRRNEIMLELSGG